MKLGRQELAPAPALRTRRFVAQILGLRGCRAGQGAPGEVQKPPQGGHGAWFAASIPQEQRRARGKDAEADFFLAPRSLEASAGRCCPTQRAAKEKRGLFSAQGGC